MYKTKLGARLYFQLKGHSTSQSVESMVRTSSNRVVLFCRYSTKQTPRNTEDVDLNSGTGRYIVALMTT